MMSKKRFGICILIGSMIGIILGTLYIIFEKNNMISVELIEEIDTVTRKVFVYYAISILCFIPHIIIHEAGHMVGALLSGYQFISYRLGSFLWMKQGDKLICKKHRVMGTAGQCMMLPGKEELEDTPYFLYHAGGVIGNLMVVVISSLLLIFFGNNKVLWIINVSMIIAGVYTILVNGIPMKINGVHNDGYNILSMARYPKERIACGMLFRITNELSEGKRLRSIPKEWFDGIEEGDLTKHLQGSIGVVKVEYLMDLGLMEEAKGFCEYMASLNQNSTIFHNELKYRLLFFELMGGCDKEKIKHLYDNKLKKRVQLVTSDLSLKRMMYAYELVVNQNKAASEKYLKEFEVICKKYPYAGEVEAEREWIDRIDRRLIDMN